LGGQHEDALAPDGGRRAASAGQGDFPLDVGLFVPLQRRVGRGGPARGEGATPLRPGFSPLPALLGTPRQDKQTGKEKNHRPHDRGFSQGFGGRTTAMDDNRLSAAVQKLLRFFYAGGISSRSSDIETMS